MISRSVVTKIDNFDRAQALIAATPYGDFGWTIKDTSATGTPTYLCVTEDGGSMKLTTSATAEAQILTMYQNDVLPYDLAMINWVSFTLKIASPVGSGSVLAFGVASAQQDSVDDVATSCWFRADGATPTVKVECDDATTDTTAVSTGATLGTTYKKFVIDFTNGLSDIRFFQDGARRAANSTFSMASAAAGQNVQLFLQLQRDSTTTQYAVQITQVGIQYRTADGA